MDAEEVVERLRDSGCAATTGRRPPTSAWTLGVGSAMPEQRGPPQLYAIRRCTRRLRGIHAQLDYMS
eukprot:4843219-Pyramimonas_sp.AAC.1